MEKKPQGYILIVLIVLMSILSIIGLHTFSLFRSVTLDQADNAKTNQAFGIAEAGLNWVLLYYTYSENWLASSNAINNSTITINNCTIDIGIRNAAGTTAEVYLTANIDAGDHILARTIDLGISQNAVTGSWQQRGLTYTWNGD